MFTYHITYLTTYIRIHVFNKRALCYMSPHDCVHITASKQLAHIFHITVQLTHIISVITELINSTCRINQIAHQ